MRKSRTNGKCRNGSKSKNQRIHATKRCFQRYGIILSKKAYDDLVEQIKSGKAELIEIQTNRVSVYKTSCKGEEVYVVYDAKRETIASFLPREGGVGYEELKARN